MKKGFTLIELLVVVLIIGILAAIALPQYFKAVEKSRAAEALTLMAAMAGASERVKLATGSYPDGDCSQYDIELPWAVNGVAACDWTSGTKNFSFGVEGNETGGDIYVERKNADGSTEGNYTLVRVFPSGRVNCFNGSTVNTDICASLGAKQDEGGTWIIQ